MLTTLYNIVSSNTACKATARALIKILHLDISKVGNVLGSVEKNLRNGLAGGRDTIAYVNIGGGAFYKPGWGVLDFTGWKYQFLWGTVDWQHNLMSFDPLPIANNSKSLFYSSHCFEHIPEHYIQHIFDEVYRCLKNGGGFRITVPDFDLGYVALKANDHSFFQSSGVNEKGLHRTFMGYYCSGYWGNKLTPEEIANAALNKTHVEFLEWARNLSKEVPEDWIVKFQDHISIWNFDLMSEKLKNAGFKIIEKSTADKSRFHEMRGTGLAWAFDHRFPEGSLYIDAVKGER